MLHKLLKKKHALDSFFYPKSIAVIGASDETTKIGGYIFSEILKTKVTAYPINIKWNAVQNVQAYHNVSEIKKDVDLVIIAIPGSLVLQAIKDCAEKGIKNIIIISAGFKETGEEGLHREEQLKEIIQKNNLKVIGPNCLGIVNAENKLNCSFAKDVPLFGSTALISQSGAVIDALLDWSFKHKVGFSKVVSLGNMAGVDELEMLEYLKDDPKTDSIVFYMETLERGHEFAKILRKVSKHKPVIIIKPGSSENAKKAIGSHTGSLAQDSVLVETLIKENNGILVQNLNELYNVLIGLKAKICSNKKLVIVTNAGGPGVIATDISSLTSFELYKLNEDEKEIFSLPSEASLNNPIDILGDAKSDRYKDTLEKLEEIDEIGTILVLLTPQIMTDSSNIAQNLINHIKSSRKSIVSAFLGDKEIRGALELFDKENFPNFQTPSDALIAMNYLYKYHTFDYHKERKNYEFDQKTVLLLKDRLKGKKGLLDYTLTKEILNVFAIGLPEKKVFHTIDDVLNIKVKSGKKYVLKVDGVLHKKDIGGVELGITSSNVKDKALEMFEKISKHASDFSITLEEEVKGNEVIVGLKSDSELGNFIMFGMGGTYVSVFKDINFSICPLDHRGAQNLVQRSKVYKILKGFRGSKPIHFEHLYEVLVRMSYLQEVFPEIKEVDLNPIICDEHGVYLVDVKLVL